MAPGENSERLRDELTWIDMSGSSFRDKAESKGLTLYLVPIGCAATVGVLITGVYNLYKKNSRRQQLFMRYRVLAQGITVAIAIFGMFQIRKDDNIKTKKS